MYVCMYVRTYVCMYVCMCVYVYIYIYICMHVCMCVCIYIYIYPSLSLSIYIYIHTHVYNYMYSWRAITRVSRLPGLFGASASPKQPHVATSCLALACLPSCDIHAQTPAQTSSTTFQLYYFVTHICSTNCLGHGRGYECHSLFAADCVLGVVVRGSRPASSSYPSASSLPPSLSSSSLLRPRSPF